MEEVDTHVLRLMLGKEDRERIGYDPAVVEECYCCC